MPTTPKKTPSHIRTIQMIAALAILIIIIASAIAYLMQPRRSTLEEAQLAYLEGRYEDSVAAFTRAISEEGTQAEFYTGRALNYLQMGRVDLAKDDFEYAISLDPLMTDIRPFMNMGKIAGADGQFDIAQGYFLHVIELAGDDAQVAAEGYFNLGLFFVAMDDNTAALENFKTAIELDSTVPEHFLRLGDSYYDLGEGGNALDAYEQYLALEQAELVPDYIQQRLEELRGNN